MASSDIGYLLNRATRRFRLDFAARLTELGLRPQQAAALIALGRSVDGRLTPSQLADAIDVDAPTASGLLGRLERDGWVVSMPNPEDGRSRFVALAEQAERVLPQVLSAAAEVTESAVAGFTADEARQLERLLARLGERDANGPVDRGGR